ncbi:hypothetical protein TA3x_003125 [Tundrisphaera sp. TA3]|uniref:hypothetical protein n=1 Tax=Tundrisphaera sp. TA3 TaxID=3435775 RepID=UPI003EBFF42C
MRIAKKGGAALLGGAAIVSGLAVLGVALAREGEAVRAERGRLDGRWVATSVRSVAGELDGDGAARYGLEFAGGTIVARGLADVPESRGTYQLAPAARPARIDLKLESGLALGNYALNGDELVVCLNPLDLPERLGLPERGRPDRLEPDEYRLVYTFRRQPR